MYDVVQINKQAVEVNKKKYEDVYKGNKKIVVTAEWDSDFGVGQTGSYNCMEDLFKASLSTYNRKCYAVNEGFDNVPVVNLDLGATSWFMGIAYGNKMIFNGDLINAQPQFFNASDAFKIKKIDKIYNYGIFPRITEYINKFQQLFEDIPITICDNQSPIDVVTQIIHSEAAMIGMFEEKEALHYLLDIVTDSIIEYNRYLENTIQCFAGFQPSTYLPFGIHIADDDCAFLSPETYREFAKPYNERLSDEFGGIVHHCCMGQAQNLQNVTSMRGFLGFDAMPDYNPVDDIINAIDGKGAWNVYNYSFARRPDSTVSEEKWFKNLIDLTEGRCGLILNVYSSRKDEALALAAKIKEYGDKKGTLA